MKICAVYGTERRGCTWHIAQEVLSRLPEAEVTEFFLPRDCPEACVSCFQCFEGGNRCCQSPGAGRILEAMLASDVILLTSPVYALHVSGPMKTFLDHYCGMWMVHKPNREMFHKQGLVIATASGPVYRAALGGDEGQPGFLGRSPHLENGLCPDGDPLGAAVPRTEKEDRPAGGADGGPPAAERGRAGMENPEPVLRLAAGPQVCLAGHPRRGVVAGAGLAGPGAALEGVRTHR